MSESLAQLFCSLRTNLIFTKNVYLWNKSSIIQINPCNLEIIWNELKIINYYRYNVNVCRLFKWANPWLNDYAPWSPILLLLKKIIKKINHLIFRLISYLELIWNQLKIINYDSKNLNVCRLFKWANPKLNDYAPWKPI